MARLEVVPFSDEHLDEAARLLAARHARQREAEPLLPKSFEAHDAAHGEVTASWHAEGASGAAAFRAGRLVGYLIGAPRDTDVWGENIWVDLAGHAVDEAEDVRDLYATAASLQGRKRPAEAERIYRRLVQQAHASEAEYDEWMRGLVETPPKRGCGAAEGCGTAFIGRTPISRPQVGYPYGGDKGRTGGRGRRAGAFDVCRPLR